MLLKIKKLTLTQLASYGKGDTNNASSQEQNGTRFRNFSRVIGIAVQQSAVAWIRTIGTFTTKKSASRIPYRNIEMVKFCNRMIWMSAELCRQLTNNFKIEVIGKLFMIKNRFPLTPYRCALVQETRIRKRRLPPPRRQHCPGKSTPNRMRCLRYQRKNAM